jgi:AcrR family transcriptional regulator
VSHTPSPRAPRADAQRNRERLVACAREAFVASDPQSASLEQIARAAGVGIGTLYRHFPSRGALVAAVYGSELDTMAALADELAADHPAPEALRLWMERYGTFLAAKRGMAETLREVVLSGELDQGQTRPRMRAAVAKLLAAGVADGSLRADARADDVLALMLGVFLSTAGTQDAGQTGRMLDLLIAGLRPAA